MVVFLQVLTILLGSYAVRFLAEIAAVAFVGLIKSENLDKVKNKIFDRIASPSTLDIWSRIM